MKIIEVTETVHYRYEVPDELARDETDAVKYFCDLDPYERDNGVTHVSDRTYNISDP